MVQPKLSVCTGGDVFAAAIAISLLLGGCATGPSATVYFREKPDFYPVAASPHHLLWGEKLTVLPLDGAEGITLQGDTPASIAVEPNGKFVATVPAKPQLGVRLYEVPGLRPLASANACNQMVSISPDSSELVCLHTVTNETKEEKTTLRIFALPSLSLLREIGPLEGVVHTLDFFSSGTEKMVAVGWSDSLAPDFQRVSHIDFYSVDGGTLVASFKQPGHFHSAALANGGDTVIWGGEEGVQSWSFAEERVTRTLSHSKVLAVALSPDKQLLAYSQKGRIDVVRLADDAHVISLGDLQLKNKQLSTSAGTMSVALTVVGEFSISAGGDLFAAAINYDNQGATEYEFLRFADNTTLVSFSRFGHFVVVWRLPISSRQG